MSPMDAEAAPPMEGQEVPAGQHAKAFPYPEGESPSAPPVTGTPVGATTTPAPTKVDAYKHRGIRNKQSALFLAPLVLRIITAVFTLIAFSVIASDSETFYVSDGIVVVPASVHFSDLFYFSYLLTVNVITFVYALVTIALSVFLLSKSSISSMVFIGIFALDQIMSYLLMSASTSAATGIRIEKSLADSGFLSKAYAAVSFSFLAFFVLAGASLISGFHALRRNN